jgi:hypothetical protein
LKNASDWTTSSINVAVENCDSDRQKKSADVVRGQAIHHGIRQPFQLVSLIKLQATLTYQLTAHLQMNLLCAITLHVSSVTDRQEHAA